MFKWLLDKFNPNIIVKAMKNIITNQFIDKMTDAYIEIRQITLTTQEVHKIIIENHNKSVYDLCIIINNKIPDISINEHEVRNIQLNKFIGLRLLDYKIIDNAGSDFLKSLNRKNKDFLIELSVMETLVAT